MPRLRLDIALRPRLARTDPGKAELLRPRFVYLFDDPSATAYEGPAVLRWQWIQDNATVASRAAAYKAKPTPGSDQDLIVRTCQKFCVRGQNS